MSPSSNRKRPAPGAYDHLWRLLPVFLAFVAVIVFVAAVDDRPVHSAYVTVFEALPEVAPEQSHAIDTSVPSAAAAMARLPEVVAEPVAAY
jgi:hypothetical protein